MADVDTSNIKAEVQANNNNFGNDGRVDAKAGNDYDDQSNDYNNDNDNGSGQSDDNDKTNLIVNYLPQQMTDEEFEELFKKFGPMKSCKIVRNRVSGYSYGFGFVDFQEHKQALRAIAELNGHELETKKIKVAFARPAGQDIKQANLYIKNIPNDWGQEDVKKVFEPYGNIIQVRVLGNNRGIAFVLFDLRKQAEDALEALNNKTVDGCEKPLEIKFAADKKVEKGSNKGSSSGGSGRRERGHRGGRNHNNSNHQNRDQNRQGRQPNQRSFFDRQQQRDNHSQYNGIPYGGLAQYNPNFNNNGLGPVRPTPANRMNRYTPFTPVQQPIGPTSTVAAAPMQAQMAPAPAYGFPAQQQMIPFAMMPAQQMAPIQPVNQAGQQITQTPISMYGTAQIPMGYAPMAQSTMSNIYSVASSNMINAANMQPQIGQPMTMRNNVNPGTNVGTGGGGGGGGGGYDDGVTLFVYNIGPDADENELRSMFAPYGNVVKCNIVRKTPGGETKGYGFVTLKDRDQANSAIGGLNGSMRNGRALQVSLKK